MWPWPCYRSSRSSSNSVGFGSIQCPSDQTFVQSDRMSTQLDSFLYLSPACDNHQAWLKVACCFVVFPLDLFLMMPIGEICLGRIAIEIFIDILIFKQVKEIQLKWIWNGYEMSFTIVSHFLLLYQDYSMMMWQLYAYCLLMCCDSPINTLSYLRGGHFEGEIINIIYLFSLLSSEWFVIIKTWENVGPRFAWWQFLVSIIINCVDN